MKRILLLCLLIIVGGSAYAIDTDISVKIDKFVDKTPLLSTSTIDILQQYKEKFSGDDEKLSILSELEYKLMKNDKIKPLKYGVALYPTPVFYATYIPQIFGGTNGKTLKLDDSNQIDELETVLYTGSVFKIYKEIKEGKTTVYKVFSDEYSYSTSKGYYIDSRFVQTQSDKPNARRVILPNKEQIIARAKSLEGNQYVRGGDIKGGISQLLQFFAPSETLTQEISQKWILNGVDCSGLLYYATDGYTPRNTSDLINYGTGVEIQGMDAQQIKSQLKPLDIIVRKGHMILVIDADTVIESVYKRSFDGGNTFKSGSIISDSITILNQILETRKPVNDYTNNDLPADQKRFVVRRRYTEN